MVDEAHGLGVFGKQGRGVCDHFGVIDDVDLIMGTFSKSLASIGGFIAGDKDTINYLRHTCRTYIFSASNTPAATAAAMEALHIIKNEPERIEKLWNVTKYALRRFKEEGFEIGDTESPIIPLYVRDVKRHSWLQSWHLTQVSLSIRLFPLLVRHKIRWYVLPLWQLIQQNKLSVECRL